MSCLSLSNPCQWCGWRAPGLEHKRAAEHLAEHEATCPMSIPCQTCGADTHEPCRVPNGMIAPFHAPRRFA